MSINCCTLHLHILYVLFSLCYFLYFFLHSIFILIKHWPWFCDFVSSWSECKAGKCSSCAFSCLGQSQCPVLTCPRENRAIGERTGWATGVRKHKSTQTHPWSNRKFFTAQNINLTESKWLFLRVISDHGSLKYLKHKYRNCWNKLLCFGVCFFLETWGKRRTGKINWRTCLTLLEPKSMN